MLLFLLGFSHPVSARVELPTKDCLAVQEDLRDGPIGNRYGKHDDFGFEQADVAPDGRPGMLRTRVPIQARLADVMPADHLHCLCLDEVAAQAADMQMELVEHVVVKGCILGKLHIHGLFLGHMSKPLLFHLLAQLGQLQVARLEFVEGLVLLDL